MGRLGCKEIMGRLDLEGGKRAISVVRKQMGRLDLERGKSVVSGVKKQIDRLDIGDG